MIDRQKYDHDYTCRRQYGKRQTAMEAIAVCRRQWDDGNDGNEFLAKIAFFNQKWPKNDLFELFDGLILSH